MYFPLFVHLETDKKYGRMAIDLDRQAIFTAFLKTRDFLYVNKRHWLKLESQKNPIYGL